MAEALGDGVGGSVGVGVATALGKVVNQLIMCLLFWLCVKKHTIS